MRVLRDEKNLKRLFRLYLIQSVFYSAFYRKENYIYTKTIHIQMINSIYIDICFYKKLANM